MMMIIIICRFKLFLSVVSRDMAVE